MSGLASEVGVGWDLKGKVALITGASTGIGKALALALAGRGVHLALGARGVGELEKVAARVPQPRRQGDRHRRRRGRARAV